MKAFLKNNRTAPRKVRLVADLVRGKRVLIAKQQLAFLPKKSAPTIEKLLDSAVANARATGATPEELFIKTITVNKGLVQKRGRPFSRGRSGVIRKTMSHIEIELGRIEGAAPKKVAAKKAVKKAQKVSAEEK